MFIQNLCFYNLNNFTHICLASKLLHNFELQWESSQSSLSRDNFGTSHSHGYPCPFISDVLHTFNETQGILSVNKESNMAATDKLVHLVERRTITQAWQTREAFKGGGGTSSLFWES